MDRDCSESFLESCGAVGWPRLRVVDTASGRTEVWAMDQPYALVGRSAGSHLLLAHPEVSRRHAYLQLISGRWYAIDLGSRTGISVVDEASREGWVDPELGIRLGGYRIYPGGMEGSGETAIDAGAGERPRRALEPGALGRYPLVELTIQRPGRARERMLVGRVLTLVGREAPADLVLDGPEVSKLHAALVLTPRGLWVVDLLGRGGVSVDGARVRHGHLGVGSTLVLGGYTVRIAVREKRSSTETSKAGLPALAGSGGGEWTGGTLARIPGVGGVPGQAGEAVTGTLDPGTVALLGQWLSPVFQHLGQMQQQMTDQLITSMNQAIHSVESAHRETVVTLKDEVQELRKIHEEMGRLQQALAARVPAEGEQAAEAAATRPARVAAGGTMPRDDAAHFARDVPAATVDVHLMLQRRIEELQAERQNRWQRILKLIQG